MQHPEAQKRSPEAPPQGASAFVRTPGPSQTTWTDRHICNLSNCHLSILSIYLSTYLSIFVPTHVQTQTGMYRLDVILHVCICVYVCVYVRVCDCGAQGARTKLLRRCLTAVFAGLQWIDWAVACTHDAWFQPLTVAISCLWGTGVSSPCESASRSC